jgi:hypothetical protein
MRFLKNGERGSALTETILLLPLLLVLWMGLYEIHKIADLGEKMYMGVRHAALILSKHDYWVPSSPPGPPGPPTEPPIHFITMILNLVQPAYAQEEISPAEERDPGQGYTREELSIFAGSPCRVIKDGRLALPCYAPLKEDLRFLRIASLQAESRVRLFPFIQKFFPQHGETIQLKKSVSFAFRKRGELLY